MEYDFLPLPQQVQYGSGGCFRLGCTLTRTRGFCQLDAAWHEIAQILGEKGVALQAVDEGLPQLCVELVPEAGFAQEGYDLEVSSERMALRAGTSQGLFYGLQTLKQMLRQCTGELRCLRIADRPDIRLRCAMIDLRFQTYHMAYLCDLIRQWSELKINAVCIEYGAHFPYEGAFEPLRSPLAFSAQEIRCFVDCCKAHFVQIIPVVQSFGHMEYLLRCPDFAHLNENRADGRFASQCCPLHPGSFEASKELIRQVYEAHDRPAVFSIGGDEAMHLGECPDCAAYVAAHGKGKLVVSYLNQLIEYAYSLGTLPMIYADMLLAYPEVVPQASKHCAIGDWDYWTLDTPPALLKDWSTRRNITVDQVQSLPEPFRTITQTYLMEEDRTRFKPFAYIDYLMKMGYPVIAHASTLSVGPSDHFTPNYAVHIPNIVGTAAALRRYGAWGMVITAWERFCMDAVSLGIAVGAEQCWNGAGRRTLELRFNRLRYGLPDERATRAMYRLSAPYTLVEKKWPKVYLAEQFARAELPLRGIVENAALSDNVAGAMDAFAACRPQASRNQADLDNWIFGAKMKGHWLQIAAAYADAMEGKDVRAALQRLDAQCAALKEEMAGLLSYCMPRAVIEKRFEDSMETYRALKAEIGEKRWRI